MSNYTSGYIPGKVSKAWTEYIAQCKLCNNDQVVHWKTKRQAEQDLRNDGWKCINGNWYCPKCSKGENK